MGASLKGSKGMDEKSYEKPVALYEVPFLDKALYFPESFLFTRLKVLILIYAFNIHGKNWFDIFRYFSDCGTLQQVLAAQPHLIGFVLQISIPIPTFSGGVDLNQNRILAPAKGNQ